MHWSKREKVMGVCVIIAIVITAWAFLRAEPEKKGEIVLPNDFAEDEEAEEMAKDDANVDVVVDVKGAVNSPGVYTLSTGDRVIDAVSEAGGLTETGDEKQINLAELLQDEMVIYVPEIGEEREQALQAFANTAEKEGKVAINSASVEELQTLPGIGSVKAEAIRAYIDENGPFKSPEDLLNVSGIGEKSLQQIEERIVLD